MKIQHRDRPDARRTLLASPRRLALAVLVTLGLAVPLASGPARAGEVLIDGIAAQVGGSIVLLSEVQEMSGPIEEKMRAGGASRSEVMVMRADVLDRLIEQRLIEDVVRRMELSATEAEINGAIQGIAQDAGLTIDQLKRSVASHGLTFTEYRSKIASEIERSKVLGSMVRTRVRVEPWEIEEAYNERYATQAEGGEEVHVRLIMVTFGAHLHRSQPAACAMVAHAKDRIAAGDTTFGEAAREISEDPNAERGGDLGWIHESEIAGWMAPVVQKLEPGQISDVVETRFGCSLFQLVERRRHEKVTLEQARAALENEVFRGKIEEEYLAWIEEMREHTYIERKGIFAEAERLRALDARRQ